MKVFGVYVFIMTELRTYSWPEAGGCGDAGGRGEGVGASVVTDDNAASVLEAAEHALDLWRWR